jgi:hypothetical protein
MIRMGAPMHSRHRPSGPADRQPPGRPAVTPTLALGLRPILLAGVGVLLILVVVQSAIAGLARLGQQDHVVAALSSAVQAHQDADMAHDALHADVLQLLTRAPDSSTSQSRQVVRQDAAKYRTSLHRLENASVPTVLAPQLRALATRERRYVADAELLAESALPSAVATQQRLRAFDRSFTALIAPMAAVTDRLAGLQAAASASSDRAHGAASRRVVAAAAGAVLTLLVFSWWLSRMSMRLVRAGIQREFATILQRSLLPTELPTHPGLRCAARYLPTSAGADVGGDWYDVFALSDGSLALVMGDVAGHDMEAASVMGNLRSALRAYALEGHPPGEVLAHLNRFTSELHAGVMATCVYGIYSADQRTLTWASAGHYPPLLVAPGVAPEYLQAAPVQLPIGAQAGTQYVDTVRPLPPGSRLLLFTDGLIERRGFGVDDGLRALAVAVAQARPGAEAMCDDALAACLPDGAASDDVALLAIATEPQPLSSAVGPGAGLPGPVPVPSATQDRASRPAMAFH